MFQNVKILLTLVGVCFLGICYDGVSLPIRESMTMTEDYHNKTDDFWKKHLKSEVYHICRQKGTEAPGSGQYDHFL